MKYAIICIVLALACTANTLSVGGYGLKGPIFGIVQSKPQPQAELEATVTEETAVEKDYLTPVDSESETEAKVNVSTTFVDPELAPKPVYDFATTPQLEIEPETMLQTFADEVAVLKDAWNDLELKSEIETEGVDTVTRLDSELVQQPTSTESLTELGKPDILVKPSFLDKSPNPSILDPYRLM